MAMDAKDLRIESALGDLSAHNDDVNAKYGQSGTTFPSNGSKPFDIGSNTLAKVDVPATRPCAVIGPDRVVPPPSSNDAYVKKVPVEPWQCTDSIYHHPPEYIHKPTEYQLSRNISPRQTFQENMQRIMVPPSFASVKNSEDQCLKNPKLMPLESKYCDVPYTVSPVNNEPKIVKSSDGLVLNNNYNQPVLPSGWASSGVNVRPLRPYGAPDLYQYSEYANCPGPRPISMIRPHRNVHEEMPQVYQDRFHEANIRFKPYPTTKERPLPNPHSRYDYIPNYPNVFQPHVSYPPHKYELQKSIPTHPYSVYPPVPLKYLERRMPISTMEKYPRSPNQQVNLNQPFCNQNMPATYGPLPGNCLQNRAYPYVSDSASKNMLQNRLYFENNNSRKFYTNPENMFANDMSRPQSIKTDLIYPSYAPVNIHTLPPHHMYRRESSMKAYEHAIHYRNIDYSANIHPLGKLPLQFSPQTMSISPSDSNASNDTTRVLGNIQDDCGYASQSSTASIRSIESGVNRITNDIYRRQEMMLPHMNKFGHKIDTSTALKDKKGLDVRQFLQMWNEGDDEGNDSNKEPLKQRDSSNSLGCYEAGNNQEQLYVLGLVNVPKEELGKYDHIQKISKLPENIKGYNSIELLNQYEKLVESPGLNQFSLTPQSKQKDSHVSMRNSFSKRGVEAPSASARPLSPLDVEAKISQSVIHKEVGCNFEIRPCSPQMMNVELATPVHNVLGERLIEKVANPVKTKSPICQMIEETNNISSSRNSPSVTSCKMVSNQYPSAHLNESIKTNYCLQDLESNSGVCLASLPRLDNDIELNFPEINQQFINDNKMTSVRDLPILDTDNGGSTHNSKGKIDCQPFINEHANIGSDSEKDVSKLSKYRKQKRYLIPNDEDDTLNMSLHRTDSVIIKNPENTKSQEEYVNNLSVNTPSIEKIVNPLNIVVENDKPIDYSDNKTSGIVNENCNDYKLSISDTALDFSLNKCDDTQSNSIRSLSNLNDALRNIDVDNETVQKDTDKFCSQILSTQLECAVTDNISILETKSSTLDDITCSEIIDDKIMLQSIDDDNQVPHTHESVIIHLKSKEIVSDISSLKEEITSDNELPLLNQHSENQSTNITNSNNVISENVSAQGSDIQNQPLNTSVVKHSDDMVVPFCKVKNNLDIENLHDHDIVKNIDVHESNIWLDKEENNELSQECFLKNSSQTLSDTETIDNIVLHNSKDEGIETVPSEPGSNEVLSNETVKVEIEISDPKQPSKPDSNVIDRKSNENVIFTNELNVENHTVKEITNTNADCSSHRGSNDIIHFAINDFDSSDTSYIQMDVLENDDSVSVTQAIKKVPEDLINEFNISPSTLDTNVATELFNSDAEPYKLKHEFIFKKELFSSRIQSLIMYDEGLCGSIKSHENENKKGSHYFYGKRHCLEPKKFKDSDKLQFEELSMGLQCKNMTSNRIIDRQDSETTTNISSENLKEIVECETTAEDTQCDSATNNIAIALPNLPSDVNIASNYTIGIEDCETTTNIPSESLKEIVEYETTAEDTHCDRATNNTATALPNSPQNDILINNVEDKIHSESFVVENCDSLPVLESSDKETYDSSLKNNIEITDKINNHGLNSNPLHLIWNQLPNKRSRTLKRSLSESAVTDYASATDDMKESLDNNLKSSRKRVKIDESEVIIESQVLNENFTNFIQSNRRNSISTIYNDDNVSFCILIDNDCMLAQDNEICPKICYTEIPDECLTAICNEGETFNSEFTENICYGGTAEIFNEEAVESELTSNIYDEDNVLICDKEDNIISEIDSEKNPYEEPELYSEENELLLQNMEDRTIEETWVEDVACMETVFSDDIAEDIVISAPSSPKDPETSEDESDNTNIVFNININEHTNKVKHIYGHQMCDDDAELVEKLFRTPQMNVNQTLIDRESQLSQEYNRYYDNESLEKILSESNSLDTLVVNDSKPDKSLVLPSIVDVHGNKENLQTLSETERRLEIYSNVDSPDLTLKELSEEKELIKHDDCLVHSCESSRVNYMAYKKDEKLKYTISSSPEVSSTTSEEKGPAILLKIRSYKGSKISEVNEMSASLNHTHSHRPLITKAAQKYIPPLKETIHDLKVKIRLPKQSLYKLQQLKKSKEKPKIDTSCSKLYIKSLPQEMLKKAKPKPKFEDVLMSIDQIQFKKHKIKNKKNKQSIPKVIIKKNENGAHYASTQAKETFNPDLTGRKWQPWVFLEKNNFVDKMALKQKFKAIYSHRKKTFVLAENFRKYKSISNAKFVISHPKSNDSMSTGNLKYTFRLKHS